MKHHFERVVENDQSGLYSLLTSWRKDTRYKKYDPIYFLSPSDVKIIEEAKGESFYTNQNSLIDALISPDKTVLGNTKIGKAGFENLFWVTATGSKPIGSISTTLLELLFLQCDSIFQRKFKGRRTSVSSFMSSSDKRDPIKMKPNAQISYGFKMAELILEKHTEKAKSHPTGIYLPKFVIENWISSGSGSFKEKDKSRVNIPALEKWNNFRSVILTLKCSQPRPITANLYKNIMMSPMWEKKNSCLNKSLIVLPTWAVGG